MQLFSLFLLSRSRSLRWLLSWWSSISRRTSTNSFSWSLWSWSPLHTWSATCTKHTCTGLKMYGSRFLLTTRSTTRTCSRPACAGFQCCLYLLWGLPTCSGCWRTTTSLTLELCAPAGVQAKLSKVYIWLFVLAELLIVLFFAERLVLEINTLSLIFEATIGLLFIVIGSCWILAMTRLLKMMKVRIPSLYFGNRKIVVAYWVTLSICLLWRGVLMLLVFAYHTLKVLLLLKCIDNIMHLTAWLEWNNKHFNLTLIYSSILVLH